MAIIGELAALSNAICWTVATNIYSVAIKVYTPFLLNFVCGSISAIVLFFIMLFFNDQLFPDVGLKIYIQLFLSGILGIAFGETFYFQALEVLGAKTAILMETLAPPFTGVLAFIYYGDTISFLGWIGIILTICGISIVIREKDEDQYSQQQLQEVKINEQIETQTDIPLLPLHQSKGQEEVSQINQTNEMLQRKKIKGVIAGALSMLFHSFGMVLSHDALRTKAFDAITSSFLRIMAGNVSLAVIIHLKKSESFNIPKQTKKENMLLFFGILLGTLVCLWCQQFSLLHTRPEITQTLIGTTPIFAMLISVAQGQKVSSKYLIGSLVALLGVFLIVWN